MLIPCAGVRVEGKEKILTLAGGNIKGYLPTVQTLKQTHGQKKEPGGPILKPTPPNRLSLKHETDRSKERKQILLTNGGAQNQTHISIENGVERGQGFQPGTRWYI